jgi:hypothetical protein
MSIGGVLRLTNHGPDDMAFTPIDKTSCAYEAAVRDCRLIRTGTVRITMVKPTGTHTLTLTVADSSPGPAPACAAKGDTSVVDTNDAMPWRAACLKLGAILRVVNHGPGNFSIEPSDGVTCFYEAAVRECRFTKAATVTFTLTFPAEQWEDRTLIVVAIK